MREILFKAKTCNGEWVQGLLAHKDEKWFISNKAGMPFAYEVRPETISQYTGLTDKNGNKIWENDICRYIDGDENGIKEETFVVKYGRHEELFKINMGFYIDWIKTNYYRCDLVFWTENRNIEVIGNVFDNTELLN